jgi:L-arabinokinase
MKKHIAYYISSHGYGHGVRSCDIIRALNRLYPSVSVTMTTDMPASFLRNRLETDRNAIRPGSFDVGMVQLDSIRVDVPVTLKKVQALYARKAEWIESETAFLRENEISLVVADIPAIPVEAAKELGLPVIAVGNFAWDWIYSEFAETDPLWHPLIREFEQGYGKVDLLLRLPFAEPMKTFPIIEDISSLVATPGWNRREELVKLTGCDSKKKWVLLSFTSLDWDDEALSNAEALSAYEFFTVKPLEWRRKNIHAIDRNRIPFSDVLASVDVVISKPGFGLMSECVVNRKPLIYADRADFREYHVLVEGIRRYLKNVHIPAELLYQGKLDEALRAIWNQSEPKETLAAGGDETAARRIADFGITRPGPGSLSSH